MGGAGASRLMAADFCGLLCAKPYCDSHGRAKVPNKKKNDTRRVREQNIIDFLTRS